MERLTERLSNGQAAVYGCGDNCKHNFKYCNSCDDEECPTLCELVEKLAYYEELEELLEKAYGECQGLLEKAIYHLIKHEGAEFEKPLKSRLLTDEDVDWWLFYKNLDAYGLLLKTYCKIGDTFYKVIYPNTIKEVRVSMITQKSDGSFKYRLTGKNGVVQEVTETRLKTCYFKTEQAAKEHLLSVALK